MNESKQITSTTIEALSRNFFKEAASYGFKYEHYLKFVNTLLDLALNENIPQIEQGVKSDIYKLLKDAELPIKSENVGIRSYEHGQDLDLINEWLKDDYGKYFLHSLILAKASTIEELLNNQNNLIGIITHLDKAIGMMAFLNYDKVQKKAELRKIIGESNLRGKGLGKEATKLWIRYGKTKLALRKIYLYTIDTNIRNVKLNEELGFKVEGILRNEVLVGDKIFDVLRMGLLF
jgi:RimJ/RimL family protein N-acetyltransferase